MRHQSVETKKSWFFVQVRCSQYEKCVLRCLSWRSNMCSGHFLDFNLLCLFLPFFNLQIFYFDREGPTDQSGQSKTKYLGWFLKTIRYFFQIVPFRVPCNEIERHFLWNIKKNQYSHILLIDFLDLLRKPKNNVFVFWFQFFVKNWVIWYPLLSPIQPNPFPPILPSPNPAPPISPSPHLI